MKDKLDEAGAPIKVVHEVVSDRWEVAVAMSEKGFQQASFVNSIATSKVKQWNEHVRPCRAIGIFSWRLIFQRLTGDLLLSAEGGFFRWLKKGAQWLTGRVLDSRRRGGGFESHQSHCLVSLSKNINPSFSTGSTQEDLSLYNWKIVDGTERIKSNKQTKKVCC